MGLKSFYLKTAFHFSATDTLYLAHRGQCGTLGIWTLKGRREVVVHAQFLCAFLPLFLQASLVRQVVWQQHLKEKKWIRVKHKYKRM